MPISTFPTLPGLGYPIRRAPELLSARYSAMSGKRTITPKSTFPRWRWELPYAFLRSAAYGASATFSELETLVAFFNSRSADGAVFKYVDAEDKTATAQNFGTGDGATTQFQLYRAYGGFIEPVYAPTVTQITVAGVPLVGADYAVGDTGIVTFDVAPANAAALAWTGTFAWLCRFDENTLDLQRVLKGLSEGPSVRFSSELNP